MLNARNISTYVVALFLVIGVAWSEQSDNKKNNQTASAKAQQSDNNKAVPDPAKAPDVVTLPLVKQNIPEQTAPKQKQNHESDYWTDTLGYIHGFLAENWDKVLASIFSGLLAWFTYLLWRSTHNLWTETKYAGETAVIAANAAKDNAIAARQSADVASAALVITQRAWLTVKEYKADRIRDEWKLGIVFENSGNTPAQKVSTGIILMEVVRGTQQLPPFGKDDLDVAPNVDVGPRRFVVAEGRNGKDRFSLDQAKRIISGEIDVYLCGTADYSDIFPASPTRHTSVCMRLSIEDPTFKQTFPFRYNAHDKYNETT